MGFCAHCGQALVDGAHHCGHCGARVAAIATRSLERASRRRIAVIAAVAGALLTTVLGAIAFVHLGAGRSTDSNLALKASCETNFGTGRCVRTTNGFWVPETTSATAATDSAPSPSSSAASAALTSEPATNVQQVTDPSVVYVPVPVSGGGSAPPRSSAPVVASTPVPSPTGCSAAEKSEVSDRYNHTKSQISSYYNQKIEDAQRRGDSAAYNRAQLAKSQDLRTLDDQKKTADRTCNPDEIHWQPQY